MLSVPLQKPLKDHPLRLEMRLGDFRREQKPNAPRLLFEEGRCPQTSLPRSAIPELAEVLPPAWTVNAWHEPRVKAAIQATGRKKLIITGISTEVCLAFPAISATAGDASGTFWQAIPMDCATAVMEILGDNADALAALDMPFAVLVGRIASALTKK
jgi:hypothetical protein